MAREYLYFDEVPVLFALKGLFDSQSNFFDFSSVFVKFIESCITIHKIAKGSCYF